MYQNKASDISAKAAALFSAIASGRALHAYLFSGPAAESSELARLFAKALLCLAPTEGQPCGSCVSCRKLEHGAHEDLIVIDKGSGRVLSADIEELQERLKMKPYGARHVVIVCGADTMQPVVQNKLLKTLEEPSSGTVIMLLAQRRAAMLDTVLSRVSCISVESGGHGYSGQTEELCMKFLEQYLDDPAFFRLKGVLSPLTEGGKDAQKDSIFEFLDMLEDTAEQALLLGSGACGGLAENAAGESAKRYKDILERTSALGSEKLALIIKEAEECRRSIRLSYSTAYALKGLCLNI